MHPVSVFLNIFTGWLLRLWLHVEFFVELLFRDEPFDEGRKVWSDDRYREVELLVHMHDRRFAFLALRSAFAVVQHDQFMASRRGICDSDTPLRVVQFFLHERMPEFSKQ